MATYKEAVWDKLKKREDVTIDISSMRHPETFIKCAKEYLDTIPYSWNYWLFSDDYSELRMVEDYKLWKE